MQYLLVLFFFMLSVNNYAQDAHAVEYESNMPKCITSRPSDGNLALHVSDCMKGTQFSYFCVVDINNKEYCSDDFKGYHLLNYWFEECPPCKKEKPLLKNLSCDFPDLPVISLSKDADTSFEDIKQEQLNWICVDSYKDKEINNNGYGYPLTMLLNKDGKIEFLFLGGINEERYELVYDFLKSKEN